MRAPTTVLILLGVAAPVLGQQPAPRPAQPGNPPAATPATEPAPGPYRVYLRDSAGLMRVEAFPLRRVRLGLTVSIEPRETDSIGAFVSAVTPGGPADRAGLRSGDLVLRLDGKPVLRPGTPPEVSPGIRVIELASQLAPNDTIALEFRRADRRRTVSLVTAPDPDYTMLAGRLDSMRYAPGAPEAMTRALAEREEELSRVRRRVPAPPLREKMTWVRIAGPLAGLELATMNPSLSEYFGVSEGVLVTRAEPGNPLGLKGGDVILSVEGRKPSSPAHLARILASYEPNEKVSLEAVRSRKHLTLTGTLAPEAAEPVVIPRH